tara:strand:- start:1770 stop:3371 length:1602 start_codon:yes stop_codon:yes gene_type:complete
MKTKKLNKRRPRMYQTAGVSETDYSGVTDWYSNYLSSGHYNHLLDKTKNIAGKPNSLHADYGGLGYQVGAQPMYADQLSKNFMSNPNIVFNSTIASDVGSHFNKKENILYMDDAETELSYIPKKFGTNLTHDSILAHELGHVDHNQMTLDENVSDYITSKNIMLNNDMISYSHHDAKPQETRADLIQLRYELERDGLFQSTGDEFTPFTLEDLQKAKGTEGIGQRLFNYFSDDDIVELMNNVAQQSNPTQLDPFQVTDDFGGQATISKKGGLRRKYQKGGPNTDPLTTNIVAPDPVKNNLMNYSLNFECDTSSGQDCGNAIGSPFRLGLKGGLNFSKGFMGQPQNLGPGWDHNLQQVVDNRIGTYQDPDVHANIGGYLRTNLPHLLNPYNDPGSFWSFLNDKNWNPVHLDVGYNYKTPALSTKGKGTHNLTGRLAHSGDHFAGRPGWGGFFGNKGGSSRPQFSYGVEGNYDLTNKQLTNIGAFGQIGLMGPLNISGSAGYNPQTGKPHFGVGFGARYKKGGVRKLNKNRCDYC